MHCLNHNYYSKEEEYNYRNDINHPLTKRAFELFGEMQGTPLSLRCGAPSSAPLTGAYALLDRGIKPDIKVINAMLGCCARIEDKTNGLKLLELLIRSVHTGERGGVLGELVSRALFSTWCQNLVADEQTLKFKDHIQQL